MPETKIHWAERLTARVKSFLFATLIAGILGIFSQVMGVPALAGIAHAQNLLPAGWEQSFANAVSQVILIINVFTWVLFTMLNFLLDPDFIFGIGSDPNNPSNLMDMLNQVWQLARDLMNVIFAISLVVAAIYTIITANKEFISQHAQKFVVAVILVNFSWFLPRVVIDVANVGASAVFGIPSYLNNQAGGECRITQRVPPQRDAAEDCRDLNPPQANLKSCRCMGVVNVKFFLQDTIELNTLRAQGYKCDMGLFVCYKKEPINAGTVAPFSAILNGLVINHARLEFLARVPQPRLPAGPQPAGSVNMRMLKFMLQEVFVVVLHIALFFPLLAMTIAFFMRIPVLWITIAFMPFYFLDYLLGSTLEQFTQGYGKKILTTFLKAAFLPMLVAVPLTIGFIMLNAGSQLTGGQAAQIPIPLFDQIDNFWQLLWLCMALGVLWTGVFTILKGDDILSHGAQSIKGFGESLGRTVLKLPLAAPIIPGTAGTSGMSVLGAMRTFHPRNIEGILNSGQPLDRDFMNKLLGRPVTPADIKKASEHFNKNAGDRTALETALREFRNGDRSEARLKEIADLLRRGGMSVTDSNLHVHLQQLQTAGLKLGLDQVQLDAIEQAIKKNAADSDKKKAAADKEKQAKDKAGG